MDTANTPYYIMDFSKPIKPNIIPQPLQQIYYGAPGTGKSHIVKKHTQGESVVRTTFHPDSDYSTFAGCYKPTTKKVAVRDVTGKIIIENDKQVTEDRIIYEFVDQAFLQAYIKAWKFFASTEENTTPKKQYLIIEEINRGNCAQIFGDLFQLLDRNDYGFSDYYIHADKDMQKHLAKAFEGIVIGNEQKESINNLYHNGKEDVAAMVLSGEILLLPNNLFIWATMNTSDQSLFPIDSAFKRRWEWKYRPIVKGRDKDGNELNWRIAANGNEYDWWSFLEKINAIIGSTTNSEDKKLGFFFCKAIDGIISAETFVGKVVFYLWNDIFKNFGFDNSIFKDEDNSTLEFDKFYTTDSNGETIVQEAKVEKFLENLKVDTAQYRVESPEVTDQIKLSAIEQARKEYWTEFLQYANKNAEFNKYFGRRKTPSKDKWYNFSFGAKDCHLAVEQTRTRNELAVELYFDATTDNYYKLFNQKEEIQDELNMNFEWCESPDNKSSKIIEITKDVNFDDNNQYTMQFDMLIDKLLRMRQVFAKYLELQIEQ